MAKAYFYDAEGKRIDVEVSEEVRDGYADEIRKQRRRNDYELYHTVSLDAITESGHQFEDNTFNPEHIIIEAENVEAQQDRLAKLRVAIKQLTPEQQSLVRQVFFEGKKQQEIADAEGVDKSAISKRMQRIYDRLKNILKKL